MPSRTRQTAETRNPKPGTGNQKRLPTESNHGTLNTFCVVGSSASEPLGSPLTSSSLFGGYGLITRPGDLPGVATGKLWPPVDAPEVVEEEVEPVLLPLLPELDPEPDVLLNDCFGKGNGSDSSFFRL